MLLDTAVTAIVDLDGPRGEAVRYGGGYRDYLDEQVAARERWRQRYRDWLQEVDSARERLDKAAKTGGGARGMRDNNKLAYNAAGNAAQTAVARATRATHRQLATLVEQRVPRPPEPLRFRQLGTWFLTVRYLHKNIFIGLVVLVRLHHIGFVRLILSSTRLVGGKRGASPGSRAQKSSVRRGAVLTSLAQRAGVCANEAQTRATLLVKQFNSTAEHRAVSDAEHVLSYRELDERSAALASFLVTEGVNADNLVAMHRERSVDLAVAIVRAGGAWLPLPTTDPAARTRQMLTDARPMFVITDRPEYVQSLGTDVRHMTVHAGAPAERGPIDSASPDDLAFEHFSDPDVDRAESFVRDLERMSGHRRRHSDRKEPSA